MTTTTTIALLCTTFLLTAASTSKGADPTTQPAQLPGESRGKYFAKKKYTPEPLPTFADNKSKLPVPILDADPGYIDMYWKCWELGFAHLKKPQPNTPLVSNFLDEAFNDNIFQWDTIFMVMFARYGHHVFPAEQSLDNFYCRQHDDGFISREIYEATGKDYHGKLPGEERWDQAINPPLFSWAEMESFRISGDKNRLALVLPVLEKYVDWLETGRKKPGTVHNLYWQNGLGSGMDNTPRGEPPDCSAWTDMSAQMVLQYQHLADICDVLGKADKAKTFRGRAKDIGDLINKWMWDDTDGLYYDLDDKGAKIKCKTLACFWPMLAGITTKAQNDKLVAHLKDPKEFWRKMPFPTLSADDPHYKADGGYWLGGVWAPTNLMVIKGLVQNGYTDFADQAVEQYLAGLYAVYKKTGTVWEFYQPDAFEVGGQKGHNTRTDFVGWTGDGPIALLIENVIGINADAHNNAVTWRIHRTDRHGVQNLRFADTTASLTCAQRATKDATAKLTIDSNKPFTLTVTLNTTSKSFQINPGKQELLLP